MVIVRLKGGLGNQMFEYAAGRSKALNMRTSLLLDTTFLNDPLIPKLIHITPRSYALDLFIFQPRFTVLSRLSFALPIPLVWPALSLIAEKFGRLCDRQTVYLKDYFQDEKYFKDNADVIRNDFTFKNPLSPEAEKIAADIRSTESICLHVRRWDYVTDPKAAVHHGFVGSGDYYPRAIKLMEEKIKNPHFFVFSDDINWCRENLKISHPTVFVSAGADDMHLMTLCKHFIIANSSFSWWAAWLGNALNKTVIAPKVWYRSQSSGGLVPATWIQI